MSLFIHRRFVFLPGIRFARPGCSQTALGWVIVWSFFFPVVFVCFFNVFFSAKPFCSPIAVISFLPIRSNSGHLSASWVFRFSVALAIPPYKNLFLSFFLYYEAQLDSIKKSFSFFFSEQNSFQPFRHASWKKKEDILWAPFVCRSVCSLSLSVCVCFLSCFSSSSFFSLSFSSLECFHGACISKHFYVARRL